MPYKQLNTFTAVNTPANGAEAVIATAGPYVYDWPNPFVGGEHSGSGGGVHISGTVTYTVVGTGATSAQIRVRQGGLTGPQVGPTFQIPVVAGTPNTIPYDVADTTRVPAQAGGVTYVLTAQEGGPQTALSTVSGTLTVDGS